MNPVDVNEEIADVIRRAVPNEIQVIPYPAGTITPPTIEIAIPDINYDGAFQRGVTIWRSRAILSVSSTYDEAAWRAVARYITPEDAPHSIHAALYNHASWTSCAYARVSNGFGVDHTVNDITYMAYQFDLEIAG